MSGAAEPLKEPASAPPALRAVRETLRFALAPLIAGFAVAELLPLGAALAARVRGSGAAGSFQPLIAALNPVQILLWMASGFLFLLAAAELFQPTPGRAVGSFATALVVFLSLAASVLVSPALTSLAPPALHVGLGPLLLTLGAALAALLSLYPETVRSG